MRKQSIRSREKFLGFLAGVATVLGLAGCNVPEQPFKGTGGMDAGPTEKCEGPTFVPGISRQVGEIGGGSAFNNGFSGVGLAEICEDDGAVLEVDGNNGNPTDWRVCFDGEKFHPVSLLLTLNSTPVRGNAVLEVCPESTFLVTADIPSLTFDTTQIINPFLPQLN